MAHRRLCEAYPFGRSRDVLLGNKRIEYDEEVEIYSG